MGADSIATLASTVARAVGDSDDALCALAGAWTDRVGKGPGALDADVIGAARELGTELASHTITAPGLAGRVIADDDAARAVVATWVSASAERRDLVLAPLLRSLCRADATRDRVERAARERVLGGPPADALACVALTGDPEWMSEPEHRRTVARLQLLLWEAGAAATSVPEIGPWLLRTRAFHPLVLHASRRTLRHRVIAACTLAVAADGMGGSEVSRIVRTAVERTARQLATHPEAAVWIPAARAMGRLGAHFSDTRHAIFEWVDSDNPGERRRGVTALASMPGPHNRRIDSRLDELLTSEADPWVVAALGPAVPHLAVERRALWERLASSISALSPPAVLWSIARGLVTLSERDALDRPGGRLLRLARGAARTARPTSVTGAQLYHQIRADTDFLDGLDPDPSDPDRLLRHYAKTSLRLGAREVLGRVRFAARSLGATFDTALPVAASARSVEAAASACSTMESCARASALRVWELVAAAAGEEVDATTAVVDEAMQSRLGEVEARLLAPGRFGFQRSALRVLGYALDATDAAELADDGVPIAPRGETVARVVTMIESAAWLHDGRTARRYRKPVADVLWRAVDATRAISAFARDDDLYPRFAAWWALSAAADNQLLELLERSEAAARDDDRQRVAEAIDAIRRILDGPAAAQGTWAVGVLEHLAALGADDTRLAEALCHVASALEGADDARETSTAANLEDALREMAASTATLRELLIDPAVALATDTEPLGAAEPLDDVGELARAARRATTFDAADYARRWCAGLGPMIAPLVERAMTALLETHTGLDASSDSRSDRCIGGYRLVRLLGEGEMGSVWLVSAEHTDRYFVMKVPAKIFERCSPEDRAGLIEALDLETQVLRSIYHPNLANMIDCGWDGDTPYLVLEYLIGVDLEHYLDGGLLTLGETRLIFADVCAGLRSLHARGLVHRDLKPGNIFLRLDLGGPEATYDPRRHRDPETTPVLGAVIIDFGIVELAQHLDEYGERIISGTLGFMAPEQARGVPTTDRADIYGLAATIYASLTGRAFFEDQHAAQLDWLRAHVSQVPLDSDPGADKVPGAIAPLLRDASSLDPRERPDAATFARRLARIRG